MDKLESWYNQQVNHNLIISDTSQLKIIKLFDKFICEFEGNQKNFLNRILKPIDKSSRNGFYIYGDVGRGKSMLMSGFYDNLNTLYKIRIHFHEFMKTIHNEMTNLKHEDNPLKLVAKNLSKKYKIIFLDEMHISDIANAMILKNLLTNLFAEKIYLVISSNFAPDNLYLDGLMRNRFIPAINLLNNKLNVIEIKGKYDYRLKNETTNNLFQIRNPNAHDELDIIFERIRNHKDFTTNSSIIIQSRQINYIKLSHNIIWLDFNVICGDGRSQLDYIELSYNFTWFIIDGIYTLNVDKKDIARRFTLLIDILYDNNKKLAIATTCEITNIYPYGEFSNEFTRTISRLQEMQTVEYLNKPPINRIVET